MTASGVPASAGEGRAWRVGDFAWVRDDDGEASIYERHSRHWHSQDMFEVCRTDAEMTAAGAVLVATKDGPVEPEPLHVIECPACGASIRARMADNDDTEEPA